MLDGEGIKLHLLITTEIIEFELTIDQPVKSLMQCSYAYSRQLGRGSHVIYDYAS